jgi:putative colanic acid biosynthesis UDP-glucose lipid carrier transferase
MVTPVASDVRNMTSAMSGERHSQSSFPSNSRRDDVGSLVVAPSDFPAEVKTEPRIRLPISYRGIPGFVASLDFLIILGSAIFADAFYNFTIAAEELSRSIAAAVFVAVLFVSATILRKFYDPSRLSSWNEQVQYVFGAWCGTFLLLASGVFAWGVGRELSRGTMMIFWAVGGMTLLVHRALWRIYLPVALRSGALKARRAIVVTWDEPISAAFKRSMSNHGYSVAAQLVVSDDDKKTNEGLLDLIAFARGAVIDDIFLVPKSRHSLGMRVVLESLRILPFPVTLVPDEATAQILRSPSYELGPHLAVEIQRPPLSAHEQALKRAFDFVCASLALIALSPLLFVVAAAIAVDSRGPIVFRQTRLGFNGQPFTIFKFRTMSVAEDGETVVQAKRGDSRVTRVGGWLRRTSLDELPQVLNVLRGEMSIVGPRPHATAHDKYFEKCVENYAFRHHVKSGITGWAQVNGSRGETDTLEKIQKRVDLDLWYINHWSFTLDLFILLRTVGVVLSGKNAV